MASIPVHAQTYRRLERRNRVVAAMRWLVPAFGAMVMAGLGFQIYLASFTGRFGVDRISITPDAITIDAPEYSGILEDGSSYRVVSEYARAALLRPDLIDLINAEVVLDRIDGVQLRADAGEARIDTAGQVVTVGGLANISNSTGITGTLVDSVFDSNAQTLTSNGAVSFDFADGTTVRAAGLVYDTQSMVWTFTRSTVTLPGTPGEDEPSSPAGDDQ